MFSTTYDEVRAQIRQIMRMGDLKGLQDLQTYLKEAVMETRLSLLTPVPERRIGAYSVQKVTRIPEVQSQIKTDLDDKLGIIDPEGVSEWIYVGILTRQGAVGDKGKFEALLDALAVIFYRDEKEDTHTAFHLSEEAPISILISDASEIKLDFLGSIRSLRWPQRGTTFPEYAKVPFSEALIKQFPSLKGEIAGSKEEIPLSPGRYRVVARGRPSGLPRGNRMGRAVHLRVGQTFECSGAIYRNAGRTDLLINDVGSLTIRRLVRDGHLEVVGPEGSMEDNMYEVDGNIYRTLAEATAAARRGSEPRRIVTGLRPHRM